MTETVKFNEDMAGDEAIASSPEVSEGEYEQAQTRSEQVEEPVEIILPPPVSDKVAQRHGRFTTKLINLICQQKRGEKLEDDTAETIGEAMGEMFSFISMGFGSKRLYFALFGGISMTLLGAFAWYSLKDDKPQGELDD
ncbi:MAG: hypothetical protein OXR68_00130 [Alphaproteobacteria bacterium]|nr:hypothetical protein [Alphaproteobacteria bacterium]MDD9919018.1 hypothetical protein [Alphaproteobacteria bacterium]